MAVAATIMLRLTALVSLERPESLVVEMAEGVGF